MLRERLMDWRWDEVEEEGEGGWWTREPWKDEWVGSCGVREEEEGVEGAEEGGKEEGEGEEVGGLEWVGVVGCCSSGTSMTGGGGSTSTICSLIQQSKQISNKSKLTIPFKVCLFFFTSSITSVIAASHSFWGVYYWCYFLFLFVIKEYTLVRSVSAKNLSLFAGDVTEKPCCHTIYF